MFLKRHSRATTTSLSLSLLIFFFLHFFCRPLLARARSSSSAVCGGGGSAGRARARRQVVSALALPVQKYTYWQEPVLYAEVVAALGVLARGGKYSVYLLYWYKRTHADAEARSFVVKAFTLLLPSSVSLLYLLSSVFAKVRQYVYFCTSITSKLLPMYVSSFSYSTSVYEFSRILYYILSNPKP
jgi:hypothetical protein